MGKLSKTASGRKCQKWAEDKPHKISDEAKNVEVKSWLSYCSLNCVFDSFAS